MALVAKPRVASQYHFNEKPHTITDDMVSHRVITVIFVLLATRSIQKKYLRWDGTYAKINRTIDNTNLSSKNIMRTTRNDGVKDWWFNHTESFRHPIIVLMLTHVSVFPPSLTPPPFSPMNTCAHLHPRRHWD